MLYDLFISHASEDKKDFVRPLANKLRSLNIEVWYDEFSLKLGDSIRRSIDQGLSKSRFGLVVLSGNFFNKNWPKYELDGLVEKEINGREKSLLFVWHNISHDEILKISPSLAGRFAAKSTEGVAKVANEIFNVIHPAGSPLIEARDLLINYGIDPPVITDSWWLTIIEISADIYMNDRRWCFPIPYQQGNAKEWGESIAWAALQNFWVVDAEENDISPLSEPKHVLDYISRNPGLEEMCFKHPKELARWAPQLTIPGFGDKFEKTFEKLYQESLRKYRLKEDFDHKLIHGKRRVYCEKIWCGRHPKFGNYYSESIGYKYFHGSRTPSSPWESPDHIFWLLSKKSSWMPNHIRKFLLEGLKKWPDSWPWEMEKGNKVKAKKDLMDELRNCIATGKQFEWNDELKKYVRGRIDESIKQLDLPESNQTILKRFIANKFAENHIEYRKKVEKKRNRKN